MSLYNVEIFDQDFNFIENTTVETVKYKEDYLDPEKSKVTLVVSPAVQRNYFIRLYGSGEEFTGIISEVKAKDDGTREITFTSVESLFDRDQLIYVDEISGTMENYIKARIEELYVTNADTYQRMPITVTTSSSTQNWDIDYKVENEKEEGEEREVAFINLLDDLIIPAFNNYDIVLTCSINVATKTVTVDVGVNADDSITIEADLPNVVDKEITIRRFKKRTNKVQIWNKKDFTRTVTYYLHSDDTFDTDGSTDRLTPVSYKDTTVSTDNNQTCIDKQVKQLKKDYSTVKKYNKIDPAERTQEDIDEATVAMTEVNTYMSFGWTFNVSDSLIYDADSIVVGDEQWGDEGDEFEADIEAWAETVPAQEYGEEVAAGLFSDKAYNKALSTFSKNKYDNLIEIEVAVDDDRVQPLSMKIGQHVSVVTEGMAYTTILSGREINNTATLIFGTIRLELTKMLKGRA